MFKFTENQKLGLSIIGAVIVTAIFGVLLSVAPDIARPPQSATPGGIPVGDYRTVSDFELTDQNGRQVKLSDFRGRPVLLAFGYTQCPDVCPLTLADFKQIKRNLGADADRVAFVLVSIDPARDTPEVMQRYLAVFDSKFIGLTGPDARIRSITDQFDASYEKQKPDAKSGSYSVAHTSFMYLFDAQNKWQLTYPFQSPAEIIAQDIRKFLPAQ
ncbi:MAG: SCO family protein [Chloroflexi bacterium]|nr:SCO family protein [Chloroflexota bacterium]